MKSEKGQALVEFALVLPILLLLICGIIDFGRILYTKSVLTSVSQQTARHASIYYDVETDLQLEQYAIDHRGTLAEEDFTNKGSMVVFDPDKEPGSNVTATLRYQIYYITPVVNMVNFFITADIPNPIIIESDSTFRVEN